MSFFPENAAAIDVQDLTAGLPRQKGGGVLAVAHALTALAPMALNTRGRCTRISQETLRSAMGTHASFRFLMMF